MLLATDKKWRYYFAYIGILCQGKTEYEVVIEMMEAR